MRGIKESHASLLQCRSRRSYNRAVTLGELKIIIRSYLDGGMSAEEFKDLFPFNRTGATHAASLLQTAVAGALGECFREGHNTGIPFERKEKRLKKTLQEYLQTDWQEQTYWARWCFPCDKCGALYNMMFDTTTLPKHETCSCGGIIHMGNGCCPH